VITHRRNHEVTYQVSPVLSDWQVDAYLARGSVSSETHYLSVPPSVVARRPAFWWQPEAIYHPDIRLYLISTDALSLNADDLAQFRAEVCCVRYKDSEALGLGYMGDELFEPLLKPNECVPIGDVVGLGFVLGAL